MKKTVVVLFSICATITIFASIASAQCKTSYYGVSSNVSAGDTVYVINHKAETWVLGSSAGTFNCNGFKDIGYHKLGIITVGGNTGQTTISYYYDGIYATDCGRVTFLWND